MLRRVLFLCLAAAGLSACDVMTPSGMIASARLDPLTTPPGALAAALQVPDVLVLEDGDAMLMLAFTPADPADGAPIEARVPLSVIDDGNAPAPGAGEAVYVFGVEGAAAAEVTDAQAMIRQLKARGVEGKGTLSVDVSGGCLTGTLGPTLPLLTYLRTEPGGEFVPLTRRTRPFRVTS